MYDLKSVNFKMVNSIGEVKLRFVNDRIEELTQVIKCAEDILNEINLEMPHDELTGSKAIILLDQFNKHYEQFAKSVMARFSGSLVHHPQTLKISDLDQKKVG